MDNFISLSIIVLFLIFIIIVGVIVSKKTKNSTGYLVANRSSGYFFWLSLGNKYYIIIK